MQELLAPATPTSAALNKERAGRNRTINLTEEDKQLYAPRLLDIASLSPAKKPPIGTINADFQKVVTQLPRKCVDLLVLDPPYNLTKDFHGNKFARKDTDAYTDWLDDVIKQLKPVLSETASIYICGDWLTSVSIYTVASKHFVVRNRITWEREKGRGAKTNWKNSSEDIWFCTVSDDYKFNVEAVKLRRKVIAPYRKDDGTPKDWLESEQGNFRDTHPSNIWTDITIPFWSMPENTDHPTQKSEKLIAKLVLASSDPGDLVLDPFLGSGTISVVAKKLQRKYLGIDINESYCLLAEKRLAMADVSKDIQGLSDGVFWERNTLAVQTAGARTQRNDPRQPSLFDI